MQKSKIKNQNYSECSIFLRNTSGSRSYTTKNKNIRDKSKIKNFGFYTVILIFAFCILSFSGCASVSKPVAFGEVTIRGKTYVPLISLCQQYGIDWEWDSFGRTISLTKQNKEIRLSVDSPMVLRDGNPKRMNFSPQFYRGIIIVPVEFREELKFLSAD